MKRIYEMTLKEKVGQLFGCGFEGTKPSEEIIDLIKNEKIGTVIYFSRNIKTTEELWKLSRNLQKYADVPLLIAVDQEGGMVTRVTEGVTLSPSNMAIGATANPRYAEAIAEIVGKELRVLGINMNLAPCIDVNNNSDNPVIGVRSYGENPKKVSEMGLNAIRGYRKANIVPVVKHFPGHGDTDTDSHLEMPVIKYNIDHIERTELYPFKEAINDNVECIMISHISFPELEKSNIPATLSKNVVNELLRKKLKFKGVVMTDCMEMKAITNNYTMGEAVIKAIEAGNDIVLISHTYKLQKEAINSVIKAVYEGRISEERINQSVERIMKLKEKFKLDEVSFDWEKDKKKLAKAENLEYVRKVIEESITIVKHEEFIPIKSEDKVLVVYIDVANVTEVEARKKEKFTLVDKLKEKHSKIYEKLITINPENEKNRELLDIAENYDKIIITSYNAVNYEGQKKFIRDMIDRYDKKLAVISLRNPYDIKEFPDVYNYIVCYDKKEMTLEAISNVLLGNIEATGKLPVTI